MLYWPKFVLRDMKYIYFSLFSLLFLNSCKEEPPLKYKVIIPSHSEDAKLPVIFFLHGWGGTLNQFIPFVKSEFDDAILIFPQAPFKEGEKGNTWSDMALGKNVYKENLNQADYSRKVLNEFINYILGEYNIDSSNIFICGVSQGAMMTLRLGLNSPYPAKGLICINGRLPMELFKDSLTKSAIDKIDIYLVNGIEDSIIPVESGRILAHELRNRGLHLESHEANCGHSLERKIIVGVKNWIDTKR